MTLDEYSKALEAFLASKLGPRVADGQGDMALGTYNMGASERAYNDQTGPLTNQWLSTLQDGGAEYKRLATEDMNSGFRGAMKKIGPFLPLAILGGGLAAGGLGALGGGFAAPSAGAISSAAGIPELGLAAQGSGLTGALGGAASLLANPLIQAGAGGLLAAMGSKSNSGSAPQPSYAPQPGLLQGRLSAEPLSQSPGTFTATQNAMRTNSGLGRFGAQSGLFSPAEYTPVNFRWGQA